MLTNFQGLMAGQMDFWQEWCEQPEQPVSTVAHSVTLRGDVDHAALTRAIRQVIAETDAMALRMRVGRDGLPEQAVDPTCRPQLRLIDLSGRDDATTAAGAMMQTDLAQPLDLCGGAMSAHWLIRTDPTTAIWYHRGHHIFLDGYAMALIEQRCGALYADAAAGPGFAPLAALLTEEDAWRASPAHDAGRAFWQDRLNLATLPAIRRGDENYATEPMADEIALDQITPGLLTMAKRLRIGWPDLLTLLSGLWLAHMDQPVMWLPWMNRMGSVAARVPAMVVNLLPLPLDHDRSTGLDAALAKLAGGLRLLRRHGRYRIEEIGRDLGLPDDQRLFFSPLVNVMPFDPPVFPGCTVTREVLSAGPGDGLNLSYAANSRGGGLSLELAADPALLSRADFARHREGLPRFLARVTQAPGDMALARLFDGL